MKIVLTCEHAGNQIPKKYSPLFKNDLEILNTHKGFDPGAYDLFQHLSGLSDFKFAHHTSRLLVEVNRSIGHPNLFSEFSKKLKATERQEILDNYYFPYRNSVEEIISKNIEKGERLLHLSIHSFTPVFNGETRKADIGLLYDPSRELEKDFCKKLQHQLLILSSQLNVRFNYPYLGKADGFTTYLRKKFPENYAGIEIEINQKFVENSKMEEEIKNIVHQAIQVAIKNL